MEVGKVRSSRPRVFCKIGVLKYFSKFTGKNLCQSVVFSKVAGLKPATLLKKRLWHRCFPVNFEKSLRTPFLQNTSVGFIWNFKTSPYNSNICKISFSIATANKKFNKKLTATHFFSNDLHTLALYQF